MPRESYIETEGLRLLNVDGFEAIKVGLQGWPDRMVITAPGHHEWVEWKQPSGRLTDAQLRRIPKMRAFGEQVHVVDDLEDLKFLITKWKRCRTRSCFKRELP